MSEFATGVENIGSSSKIHWGAWGGDLIRSS